jgi:M6 family metalloprotease-like protein
VTTSRRVALRTLIVSFVGSQALSLGLASSVFAAQAPGRAPWRVTRGQVEAARTAPQRGQDAAARRLELRRAVPDHLGPVRHAPWITRGRMPLARSVMGRLQRSTAFAGVPDTVRVLGIRVDFNTDRLGSQTTTPDGRFDMRDGKAVGIAIDPPPHDRRFFLSHLEAMSRYWHKQSYGNLVVLYDVYPKGDSAAYRLGDTGDYGPWTLGSASYDQAQRFFKDAIRLADATDSIPFGNFDVVCLFHAGSDFQSDVAGNSPRDFPTFQIGLTDSVAVNGGAVGVHGGMVMPETENQDGLYGALNGTMAHEFGHTQGLPDLYDINTFFPAVGVWSNMDSGYLLSTALQDEQSGAIVEASGVLPVSLDPWCKSVLWPDGVVKVDPGRSLTTSLRSSQLQNRLLRVPLGADEYLLVENRQADLNGDNTVYLDRDSTKQVILGPGFSSADPSDSLGDREYDFLLPGQGVLVWHVDETVICTPVNDSTFLCGPNANPDFGINSNPERRGLRLLEADGIEDIGNPKSSYFFGSPFDPYFIGNHTRLSDDTNPSSRTNDGARGHIDLRVQSVPGVEMTVSIDSDWRLSGWPVSAERALNGNAPTTGIFLRDGRRSVVASADSLIYGWMADGSSFYSSRTDGEWAALPSRIRGAVLFADSIFKGSAPTHGAGVVATGMDGNVYAFRPEARTDATSSPLIGWPPVLDTNAPSVTATTAPVLASSAAVIVGGSDGRIFAITPQDSAVVPLVAAICDTLIVGGFPVVSDVSSNLAVGRFTGAGGYQVAYALRNGTVRVVDQASKDPGRFQAHWNAGAPGFEPYLLGVDMDRAADRNLELVVVDPLRRRIHCYDLAGAELPGWPVYVPAGLPGPVAAGDLDGDGYPEIFAVDAQGYAHRWNRNGVEGLGWPVSLTKRYGPGAVGGSGSPIVGDVDGDGLPEALLPLENGILVALEADGRASAGWPISVPGGGDDTPLLLTLNGADMSPNPAGPAWLHLVAGGGFNGSLGGYQLAARADSALVSGVGVSIRTPWPGFAGDRRRSSVLDDLDQGPLAASPPVLQPGSVYCYPNPARGDEIGVAYTLGAGVTEVIIRVLDPLGNEVSRVTPTPGPAENVAKIGLRNLASGVYLVRVEARRGGVKDVVFQKFAVVK